MDFWTRLLRSCRQMRRAHYLKTNAGGSSRGLISASHARRSTAFLAACQTRRDHLRVLRASAFICVKTLLVLQHLKTGNAGRDRARTQPAQAAAGAGLIGRDHCAGVPAHPAGSRDSVWVGEIGRFFSLPHGTGTSECKVPAGCTSTAFPRNDSYQEERGFSRR